MFSTFASIYIGLVIVVFICVCIWKTYLYHLSSKNDHSNSLQICCVSVLCRWRVQTQHHHISSQLSIEVVLIWSFDCPHCESLYFLSVQCLDQYEGCRVLYTTIRTCLSKWVHMVTFEICLKLCCYIKSVTFLNEKKNEKVNGHNYF